MSVENNIPNVEVNCSVMNLFDLSVFYTTLWPVEAFVDTVRESGYNGLEWHPLRAIAGLQMNQGLVSQHSKETVRSLHQSWRSETNLAQVWNNPNRFMAFASYLLLQERVASLTELEKLQKVVGRALPVTLYPSRQGEDSGTSRLFGEKLFQPTPEVMFNWRIRTAEALIAEACRRGYTGFALDLYHMRGQEVDGVGLNPWQETLPKLLPYTKEIHVSAGRVDVGSHHIDTEDELQSLIKHGRDSELYRMMKVASNFDWTGQIVTEIPAMALHRIQRRSGSNFSVSRLVEDHKKIVDHINTIFAYGV